jgi:hypothetical protein
MMSCNVFFDATLHFQKIKFTSKQLNSSKLGDEMIFMDDVKNVKSFWTTCTLISIGSLMKDFGPELDTELQNRTSPAIASVKINAGIKKPFSTHP